MNLSRENLELDSLSNETLISLIKDIKVGHLHKKYRTKKTKSEVEFWNRFNKEKRPNNYTIFHLIQLYQCLVDELIIRFEKINSDTLDPKYLGIPNIYFGFNVTDEREENYKKQRIERGFDNSEMWSLDVTISKFILPRLKEYRDTVKNIGVHPDCLKNNKEWIKLLDKMIRGFEVKLNSSRDLDVDEEIKIIDEGLDIFTKYFGALWY